MRLKVPPRAPTPRGGMRPGTHPRPGRAGRSGRARKRRRKRRSALGAEAAAEAAVRVPRAAGQGRCATGGRARFPRHSPPAPSPRRSAMAANTGNLQVPPRRPCPARGGPGKRRRAGGGARKERGRLRPGPGVSWAGALGGAGAQRARTPPAQRAGGTAAEGDSAWARGGRARGSALIAPGLRPCGGGPGSGARGHQRCGTRAAGPSARPGSAAAASAPDAWFGLCCRKAPAGCREPLPALLFAYVNPRLRRCHRCCGCPAKHTPK